jgi:hypothetical protein
LTAAFHHTRSANPSPLLSPMRTSIADHVDVSAPQMIETRSPPPPFIAQFMRTAVCAHDDWKVVCTLQPRSNGLLPMIRFPEYLPVLVDFGPIDAEHGAGSPIEEIVDRLPGNLRREDGRHGGDGEHGHGNRGETHPRIVSGIDTPMGEFPWLSAASELGLSIRGHAPPGLARTST